MDQEMPFFDHLRELRRRIMTSLITLTVAWVIAYTFYNSYIGLVINPLMQDKNQPLQMLELTTGFVMRVKLALYVAIIISTPLHIYNIVAFIMPALSLRERRFVGWSLCAAFVLAIIGALFSYLWVLPLSVKFLASTDFVPEGVVSNLNFEPNVYFVFQFVFAFVIVFQLPLVQLLLMALGVVERKTLLAGSRQIIVLIFIISAIVTPPDIVSQIGLAIPLIFLFYAAILVAKIFKLGESTDEPDAPNHN